MTISKSAKDAAAKLPPDVLMHPMPFPDRLDYAEKIVQEAIDKEMQAARDWNALLELELKNLRGVCDDERADLRTELLCLCEKMEAGISGAGETVRARRLLE